MMIQRLLIILLIALSFSACQPQKKQNSLQRFEEVEQLISQMTLEEKVGQMTQITLDVLAKGNNIYSSYEPLVLDSAMLYKAIAEYHIGSVLNTANNRARTIEKWNEIVSSIQDVAQTNTRLKIPIIYGIDAIHGATYSVGATMFPQQIAQAATWNTELVKEAASITAYEVRASSIAWNFSPVLDLGIDPRWARQWETFGEDPYLCAQMGEQVVSGYQGDGDMGSTKVAACLKHFLGYSVPTSGKDRTPATITKADIEEYHLPSFKKAIEAGAKSIMINSGIINNQPVHASSEIITKLLKQDLGFKGLVVTDWYDIENLYSRDKVAHSHKEAIKLAINAGIDMSMVPYDFPRFCNNLVELVNEGEVSMARIDDAVRRILNLKFELNLFKKQNGYCHDYPKFGSSNFEQVSYRAASEAITLLKNENHILPLKKGMTILVTGPNANSMRTLNGGWTYSWQGEKTPEYASEYNTILEAVQKKFGEDQVLFEPGVEYNMHGAYWEDQDISIKSVVSTALKSDVVLLCLGENSYTEKPGDLHDLSISRNQEKLAMALAKTGKPVVLILNEGRPRIIDSFASEMKGIIQTYLPGNFGGDALADILIGEVNPSGKLPYTYPKFTNSLVPYIHKYSEESITAEGMYDYGGGFYPQFEFGFGLSYTSFEYSDLKISSEYFTADRPITVSVKIKNTGNRSGKEVVQLYSSDLYASVTPDVKRLRRFKKIELAPGEEKLMSFSIDASDLSFINANGDRVTEPGDFELRIQQLKTKITLKSTPKQVNY